MSCRPLSARDLREVLDATADLWEPLRGQRLFVTGGSGFFGTWLLETYLAACERFALGSAAMVLTRDAVAFEAKLPHIARHHAIGLLQGDVRSFVFPHGEFGYVVHAATEASATLNDERPDEMFDTIVAGTRRVLDFAAAAGTRRLLFTSSGAVYGTQPSHVSHIREHMTFDAAPSAYTEGKRTAEQLCAKYATRLDPLIARGFAFVGPHLPLDRHFAIGNFIADALAGRPIEIRGDGTPLRSYLYASDLAAWLWTILFRGAPLRPYNVGSERAIPIADIAREVAACVEPHPPVRFAATPDPTRPPSRYVPSTERARNELGLRESVPLREAIARTIAWHREHANP